MVDLCWPTSIGCIQLLGAHNCGQLGVRNCTIGQLGVRNWWNLQTGTIFPWQRRFAVGRCMVVLILVGGNQNLPNLLIFKVIKGQSWMRNSGDLIFGTSAIWQRVDPVL